MVHYDRRGRGDMYLFPTYTAVTRLTRVSKRVSESLAKSRAYNPIRDSGKTLGERKKSRQEICRESHQEFGETLGGTFRARQASPQSLGSDYMHGSPQDSLGDSFFDGGKL